jgi:hypothetical protein
MAQAPTKKPGTAVANWDEELARQADVAAGMEANVGGGQFFSAKGGVLQFDGSPLPGNQAAVVIVDTILENVYYECSYNPDSPQAPTCFAFGREDNEMEPHASVDTTPEFERQSDVCHGCPMNDFGTAVVGRGKACRNTRRLALIPAGSYNSKGDLDMFDDVEHFAKTPIAFMKMPVTSVKGYATFVKQVSGALRRPPHGVFTRISVIPDAKTQFKVLFEVIEKVPNELMSAIMQRHTDAGSVIEFPYSPVEEAAAPARGSGKAAPAKKTRKY